MHRWWEGPSLKVLLQETPRSEALSHTLLAPGKETKPYAHSELTGPKTEGFHDRGIDLLQMTSSVADVTSATALTPRAAAQFWLEVALWRGQVRRVELGSTPSVNRRHAYLQTPAPGPLPPARSQALSQRLLPCALPSPHPPPAENRSSRETGLLTRNQNPSPACTTHNERLSDPLNILNQNTLQP